MDVEERNVSTAPAISLEGARVQAHMGVTTKLVPRVALVPLGGRSNLVEPRIFELKMFHGGGQAGDYCCRSIYCWPLWGWSYVQARG